MTQRFDLGVHYTLRGEYDLAVRAFREVVREEPQNPRAWSFLGRALAHVGEAREAEAALSRAISLAPLDGEAWFHLGVARSLRDEWPEAVSAYRKAVALIPTDMVAWHRLGVAFAESGDRESASVAFERALVLSRETGDAIPATERPNGPTPDSHLAETGEKEDSREAQSWIDLALSLLSLGDEEEAVAAYERAYVIDPKRASRSLFRPMLRLLTAAAGRPLDDESDEDDEPFDRPPIPMPRRRPEDEPPERRPEVA